MVGERLILTPNQEKAVNRIINEPTRAVLNGSELATGKTVQSVSAIQRLGLGVNLITAPLHTRDGWERTFDSQSAGEIRWVNNKNNSGKNAWSDLQFGVPGNYFMGREFARLQRWNDIHVGTWVADECHTLSDPNTLGFKRHAKPGTYGSTRNPQKDWMNAEFRIFQSATWFGAEFGGAWGIARQLWPDRDGYQDIADRSQARWTDHWCVRDYQQFWTSDAQLVGRLKYSDPQAIIQDNGTDRSPATRWEVRATKGVTEKRPGAFVDALPCYVKIKSDLPELEPIEIRYDLSRLQRKMYDQMESESLAWLRDNPLAVELDGVRRIRLREIALAEPVLLSDGSVDYPADAKSSLYETLREVEENLIGEQILMGTHSAKFARLVARRMGNEAFGWTGAGSDGQKAQAKQDFLDGRLKNIVATQRAIGEGVDGLQHAASVMFELSLDDWTLANQQFRGRLNRPGQRHPVVLYRFIANDTLDDPQHESLLQKELAMRASMK